MQSSSRPLRLQPFGAPVDRKAGQDTVGSERRLSANTAKVTCQPPGPPPGLFLPRPLPVPPPVMAFPYS